MGDRPGSLKLGSSKLLILEGESQGVQAVAAYSATLRCVAMWTVLKSCFCHPRSYRPRHEGGWFAESFAGTPF